MVSIERTAYPRFDRLLSDEELRALYQVSAKEHSFIQVSANGESSRLTLTVMLKTRQQLGYFPALREIPDQIRQYLAEQLGDIVATTLLNERSHKTSLHRHRNSIRSHLGSRSYAPGGRKLLNHAIDEAAETMSDPADLVNVAIEELFNANIELPAFSTLDRLVGHRRQRVHADIFSRVAARLADSHKSLLDDLLKISRGEQTTGFTQIKQSAGTPTITHIRKWAKRLDWLAALIDPKPFLIDVAHTKVRQFSAEAAANEISDMRNTTNLERRYTLLLCLLHETQAQARDDLVEMFLRRMRKTENVAKDKLSVIQQEHRAVEENLMSTLATVLHHARAEAANDEHFGREVRQSLNDQGGIENLQRQYEAVSAYHQNNYLPLMLSTHGNNRSTLFYLLSLIAIQPANQDARLTDALAFVTQHRHGRRDLPAADIDISFASDRWHSFITSQSDRAEAYDKRSLELCIFWYVAEELRNANLYVEDSQDYNDPRAQLLPWEECERRLPEYCKAVGLPDTPAGIVAALREQLHEAAENVDADFPDNEELTLGEDGKPRLKRQKKAPPPENLKAFQDAVRARMPEHHLLDILNHTNHWTQYTRHFGPPSGSDPKLSESTTRYLFTLFGYGCFLGPSQTERHAPAIIKRQTLRRINAQHISTEKLEAALRDLINEYTRFHLPRFWGQGDVAITDGTHIELVENNLLGDQHIRYGGYGGIAYHHISDNYIALFCNFIACGVWEAIYIFDGLMQNTSKLQPHTLHADTQGQSEPVFALARLLGIKLFPRMRNWNDVTFYRPKKSTTYKHIDALFTEVVDWDFMERHVKDMLQVALSIQAGKVLPSMLLRRLGTRSRKNKLYRAFRELGRVERTLFLLRYISEPEFRFGIRAETTKIESFHDFMDWIAFGGSVIKSGDPVEQAKRMKYLDVIANAIMLQNVVDLTDVLNTMAEDGFEITPELVASLSPYIREHILRFGRLMLDTNDVPKPLKPKLVPFAA